MATTESEELHGEDLDRRAAELNIEGRSSMTADEKRKAVAKAERASESEKDPAEPTSGGPTAQASQVEAEQRGIAEDAAEGSEEEFRAQQRADAAAQGLTAENAVPERRPQASQQLDSSDRDSELTKKLREAGDQNVAPEEPHGKAEYDRAESNIGTEDAQGIPEGPMVGNVVRATKGPHEGRVFAVLRVVEEGSVGDMIRRLSGAQDQVLNQPKELELRALGDERDGEIVFLKTEEAGLVKLNEAFRGTRAGRLH